MLRRLPDLALLAGAVFLEWLALREIAGASRAELHFAHFAVEHAAASILAGYSARRLLPPGFRDPALWASVFIGVFCLFLPVFGLAATLALLVASTWLPLRKARGLYGHLSIPRFSPPPEHASVRFGEGGIRSRLHAHEVGIPARLKTLLAVQAMPTRQGNRLMREVLNDSSDDIRLLAYGMLDRQEKSIAEAIHAELGRLAAASGADSEARHRRRLAFLFWEQVYQELVEGDLRRHAVEQAASHAEAALAARPEDGALWSLLGQARIARGDFDEAERCLERAETLGAPPARTRPWLAELAFRRRDFAAVRRLLASSPALAQVASLGAIVRFWKPRETPA